MAAGASRLAHPNFNSLTHHRFVPRNSRAPPVLRHQPATARRWTRSESLACRFKLAALVPLSALPSSPCASPLAERAIHRRSSCLCLAEHHSSSSSNSRSNSRNASKMVADTLVYHPTVAHYLRFLATTVGRDKVLRTLQYFARFYAWHLLRAGGAASQMAPWSAVKKQLGLTRKILRLGKNLEHVKAAAQAADAKSLEPFLRYAAVGRQLGYAGYLSLDALTVADAAGIRRWEAAQTLQRNAYRFWAMGLSFSIVSQFYTLYRLRQREARIDRKDGEGVVESKRITKERAASQLQLLSDLADLTIPSSALGWASLDDGIVGLAGTLSSVLGIYNQWKKTA